MEKLTCECVPVGVEVLPKVSEVEALEGAFLAWHGLVESRYGEGAAYRTWRQACRVVVDFENGGGDS